MSVMTSSSERTQRINIFCMYALRKSSPVIDEQNFKFGDSFAQVTNGEELSSAINRSELVSEYRRIMPESSQAGIRDAETTQN